MHVAQRPPKAETPAKVWPTFATMVLRPGDPRVNYRPQRGRQEAGAGRVGDANPPMPVFLDPVDEVGLAVTVEVEKVSSHLPKLLPKLKTVPATFRLV